MGASAAATTILISKNIETKRERMSEEECLGRGRESTKKARSVVVLETWNLFRFGFLKLGIGSSTPERRGEIQIYGGLQSKSNLEGGRSDVHVFWCVGLIRQDAYAASAPAAQQRYTTPHQAALARCRVRWLGWWWVGRGWRIVVRLVLAWRLLCDSRKKNVRFMRRQWGEQWKNQRYEQQKN